MGHLARYGVPGSIIALCSLLVSLAFQVPIGGEGLFRYFIAPLGGIVGYGLGEVLNRRFMKNSERILAAIISLGFGLIFSLIMLVLYMKMLFGIDSPSLFVLFSEALLFSLTFAGFFFGITISGLRIYGN